jgi:hypothetical protein
MKMIIITNSGGHMIGAVQGASLTAKQGDVTATVGFAAGHQQHHVVVDDSISKITDAAQFHEALSKYIPKSG